MYFDMKTDSTYDSIFYWLNARNIYENNEELDVMTLVEVIGGLLCSRVTYGWFHFFLKHPQIS